MIDAKRLQELARIVSQRLSKKDRVDLLTLIDSTMKPVSDGCRYNPCNECEWYKKHTCKNCSIQGLIKLLGKNQDNAMPVSEEVNEAITVLNRINHTREQIARMVLIEWAQPQKAIQQALTLAIEALKQYQEPKPCEYCKDTETETIFAYYKCHDKMTVSFCPNCGKFLGDKDGK